MIGTIRKALVAVAIAALMIMQVAGKSAATTSATRAPALAEADLSTEGRILDTYVDNLVAFDKKGAELRKKATITHVEYELHERTASDLKGRLSAVQNAVRRAIDKLKAAGQWDNFEQIVLAKISDAKFQTFVRARGLKKTLEAVAEGRSINVNEILRPLDALRNKVHGHVQDSTFERSNSTLASLAVRVAYTTTPTTFTDSLRCVLAHIRVAITRPFNGGAPSDAANDAFNCYCLDFNCPTT